jgi:protein TonB
MARIRSLLRTWLGRTGLADPLLIGVCCSILVHGLLLAMRFAPVVAPKLSAADPGLEIVLLNARTRTPPPRAQVAAQFDLTGGGDRDEGRARSPLQASQRSQEGDVLKQNRERVAELEAQQRRLFAMTQPQQDPEVSDRPVRPLTVAPTPDDAQLPSQKEMARLQAQIDQQVSDYNMRPRKLTFGIDAIGVSYAQYVQDWADRIEQLGTEHYPPEARGRLYDSLICTVQIDREGHVLDVVINKPSRHKALNQAVLAIVRAGAPYPKFTPQMARESDILQIVRTWTFTRKGLNTEAVQ